MLEDWQEYEIIRPAFGEVVWSTERSRYVRRFKVVYIVLGRKNGKSELAAGVVLYLLVGDDEESAEVYGAAKDTKQAGKVSEVVNRMRVLSPVLAERLEFNKNSRRIFDEKSSSYYEVITADALGELGHNPHGFVLDEVLSQKDDSLWNALKTASGARTQPQFWLITTETNDPSSFGAGMIDEAERIQADPTRSPHSFAYVRKTSMEANPWDEDNWAHANPALGSFLSLEALRQDALDARNDPTKENAFRQYRLNQRVQQVTRWMPLHLWDKCGGLVEEQDLLGELAFAGVDLSATSDLASLCWFFPGKPHQLLWRFWAPEAVATTLGNWTGGEFSRWVREGLITLTEGEVLDYEVVEAQIIEDTRRFKAIRCGIDRWNSASTVNKLAKAVPKLEVVLVPQTYQGMSAGMKELMKFIKGKAVLHGGNPVARWNADSIEARQDPSENIRPVKPDRATSGKRIDGMTAAIMAIDCWLRWTQAQVAPAVAGGAKEASSVFSRSGRLGL